MAMMTKAARDQLRRAARLKAHAEAFKALPKETRLETGANVFLGRHGFFPKGERRENTVAEADMVGRDKLRPVWTGSLRQYVEQPE